MNQALQVARPPMNAMEMWSLYDTVLIGNGMKDLGRKWYDTFAELGSENEVPFFNQRNRSTVGVPYNSFDSAEQISFGFECHSIGVEWYAPVISETQNGLSPAPASNSNPQMFMELLKHASFRLQVSQDEKLLINALGAPGGGGLAGSTVQTAVNDPEVQAYSYQNVSNGVARLQNRFHFAEPIRIPRNRNIAGWIEFSNYGQEVLKRMPDPEVIDFSYSQGEPVEDHQVSAVYMLRVSMIGKREVQQRNNLHF
jgi:hypothetical protein